MQDLGRAVVVGGVLLIGVGVLLQVAPKVPWLGRLPGDVLIQRPHVTVYIPLTSGLLVSGVVSIVWWLAHRFKG